MHWFLAMFAILPFVMGGGLWSPRLRTWLALMGASLATYVYQSHGFYIAIDLVCAGLILAYPVTQWQRVIGLLFVVMGFLVLGNYLSLLQNSLSAGASVSVLVAWLTFLGWVQFGILAAWGGYDFLRRYRITDRVGGGHAIDSVEP